MKPPRVIPLALAALLASTSAVQSDDCDPAFDCVRLPGGTLTWARAAQVPGDLARHFEGIDYGAYGDGIGPLDTTWVVPVPDFVDLAEGLADLEPGQPDSLARFGRHVARDSVFAVDAAVCTVLAVDALGRPDTLVATVAAGDLLIAARADFPPYGHGDVPEALLAVKLLRAAGVDSVRALTNLAFAILQRRLGSDAFDELVKSPTIYESYLDGIGKRKLLMKLFDNDSWKSFERIDALNKKVKKKVVFTLDLMSVFPIRMIRFFPMPQENPVGIAGYGVEGFDGVSVKRGEQLVDIIQPRLGARVGSSAYKYQEGDLPVFEVLAREENNLVDTVAVEFPKPRYINQIKFRSLTNLDYDVAEFEVYSEGFAPTVSFLSKPLPMVGAAVPHMLEFLDLDLSKKEDQEDFQRQLDRLHGLEGGTLGRLFWDEVTVGDSTKSEVIVSMQTGHTPEPLVLYRLNVNRDVVPWRVDAKVVDRRPGSPTYGDSVNLDDDDLRAVTRDIWNALSPEERSQAQTTTPEYLRLTSPEKRDRKNLPLEVEADVVFWTGFQPLKNGRPITVAVEAPFYQLRIDFTSRAPGAATFVRNLRFEVAYPPALKSATAEIAPAVGVAAGADTQFTYAIRPQLEPEDAGFNCIRVATPAAASEVQSVEFAYGSQDTPAQLLLRTAQEYRVLALTDSFFVVRIPHVTAALPQSDSLVILLRFRGRVLSVRSDMTGHVFLLPEELEAAEDVDYAGIVRAGSVSILPQRLLAGNVVEFGEDGGDRNSLQVVTGVDRPLGRVIARLQVSPRPFTPNGDGVNDVLMISFDVLHVIEAVPVTEEVYDLSGRRVWHRALSLTQSEVRGADNTWTGVDDAGNPVPPGIYLLKVRASTDEGEVAATRIVPVAY